MAAIIAAALVVRMALFPIHALSTTMLCWFSCIAHGRVESADGRGIALLTAVGGMLWREGFAQCEN
jgi:hypothetical protein